MDLRLPCLWPPTPLSSLTARETSPSSSCIKEVTFISYVHKHFTRSPLIRLPETARPPELPGALHHGRLGRRGVARQQRRVRRHRRRSQRGGRRCRPEQRGGVWRRRPLHGFCKKLRAGFHLVPTTFHWHRYACWPMQNEDIIQVNMYLLSVPVFTLFLGETSGLGRRGAKGDCGVAAAAF